MEYLNINVSILDSEEFLDAPSDQHSVWLRLMRYCAVQENGGCIPGCRTWSDQKCLMVLRCTRADLDVHSQLWVWENDDLEVEFYPAEQEKALRAKRRGAKEGSRRRWTGKSPETPANSPDSDSDKASPNGNASGNAIGIPNGNASGDAERKGRKGKVRERKNLLSPGGDGGGDRPRNLLFDELAKLDGWAPGNSLTAGAGGRVGKALSEIRGSDPEVTPDEIRRRATHYRAHYPGAGITSTALAAHWARCAEPPAAQPSGIAAAFVAEARPVRMPRITGLPETQPQVPTA